MIESEAKTEYNFCDRFSGNKQKMFVCKRVGSLKSFLSKSDGLNLKSVINERISDLETEIPQEYKDKFIEGANLLQSLGKISKSQKEKFIEDKVQYNNRHFLFDR